MLQEMGKAAGMNYYQFMCQRDLAVVPLFREKGVTVTFIPQDIADEMVSRSVTLYAEYAAADPFFDKVYSSIEAFKSSYRDSWQRM